MSLCDHCGNPLHLGMKCLEARAAAQSEAVGCLGKDRHETHAMAQGAVQRMHRRKAHVGRLKVYRCEHCKCWHIGGAR